MEEKLEDMKTEIGCKLRLSLYRAGYSEKTADKILNWYTIPINCKIAKAKH